MRSAQIGKEFLEALGIPTDRVLNAELHLKGNCHPVLKVEYVPDNATLRNALKNIVKNYGLVEIEENTDGD
jgi:hypothetical protein